MHYPALLHTRAGLVAGCTFVFLLVCLIGYKQSSLPPVLHIATRGGHDLIDDTQNATLGFQKIYVINLPSRVDHRDASVLAAAFTGLEIEYVDGVTHVDINMLPPGGKESEMSQAALGAIRAHLNVARLIVDQNISSALILEDDTDWDIRIKQQMRDFAKASRLLVQPLAGTRDKMLDPTYPSAAKDSTHTNLDIDKARTGVPTTSPYGDLNRWDVFWLGHCGARFPNPHTGTAPLGRGVISNDVTVPEKQHIDTQLGGPEIIDEYPDHTRVVSRSHEVTCSLAYGVSQAGARRMLYEMGVHKIAGAADMMLNQMCDGAAGRDLGKCLTVQPALFNHHRPIALKSTFSDISNHGDDYNEVAFTRNVRWSTRVNFAKLVSGNTEYIDHYKDGEEGVRFP